MARRHGDKRHEQRSPTDWEGERTLAAAEEDRGAKDALVEPTDTRCLCGSEELLLEAFLQVVDGRPVPQPVEVETLTCPQCGREFEAVLTEDGRVLRGEFQGYVELD